MLTCEPYFFSHSLARKPTQACLRTCGRGGEGRGFVEIAAVIICRQSDGRRDKAKGGREVAECGIGRIDWAGDRTLFRSAYKDSSPTSDLLFPQISPAPLSHKSHY